ncbi:MAG: hypothetical protein ABSE43_01310 [Steroidobacteraceae bacterium]
MSADAIAYPVGETWIFDIGVARIEHRLESLNSLRYRVLSGERAGSADRVAMQVQALRDSLFMVSWQEADGITVVHVEDFTKGCFEACVTFPGGRFERIHGTMSRAG